MTTINSAQSNQVGFQCRNCRQDTATYHPLPAISSTFVPGSGQFLKGDSGKGFSYLATDVGLMATMMLAGKYIKNKAFEIFGNAEKGTVETLIRKPAPDGGYKAVQDASKLIKKPRVAIALIPLSLLGIGINHIRSAIDAYQPKKVR